MPDWPTSLPALPLAESYGETQAVTVIRTEMETGPAKARRRTTAGVSLLNLSYILSRAEAATLEEFFENELAGGALQFSFPHPRKAQTVGCRFRRPPALSPINGDYFRAGVELEVLP